MPLEFKNPKSARNISVLGVVLMLQAKKTLKEGVKSSSLGIKVQQMVGL